MSKHRIYIPNQSAPLVNDTPDVPVGHDDVNKFLNNTMIKRMHVNIDGRDIHFTQREMEVTYLSLRKMTAKTIAKQLNLSARTVESYLDNAKLKVGCHSKSELCDILRHAGLERSFGISSRRADELISNT